jgi:pimeloyl-ACP methyl ester carboxylesterase
MRTILASAAEGRRTALLLALLGGSLTEPEDFVREGFPQALRDHGIYADLSMSEMKMAWFADGSVVSRIRDAVVAPARARGHTHIWMAGISLGALAALCYAARHEEDLAGVTLITPYPATRDVLREIEAAGGLANWRPTLPPEGDLEREAWLWLIGHDSRRAPQVHCYLASGDRFAEGQRQMAQALDPACVRELPGGHDWTAWRSLWSEFLTDGKAMLQ